MTKNYKSLGLMSGTSGDGVDASIIQSDGEQKLELISDKFFKYDEEISKKIHELKEKLNNFSDLEILSKEIKILERKITMFHANVVQEITLNNSHKIDLVGFHGQTMFHSFKEKKSKQLGDANLLHQLTKKKIVYNFRANDILDGGQGAPLTPIFHHLLIKQKKINLPTCILNIGGIANITAIKKIGLENIRSKDIGPGNCLIDEWVRKNSNKNYDEDGKISSSGNINEIILEQAFELFLNESDSKTLSLDTKDFDVSFVRGLSLEDGAATLTELTSRILSVAINSLDDNKIKNNWNILLCGGGRKNKDLIKKIKNNISKNFQLDLIDKYEFDGDFIESQAFAYLAIRSFLSLPLSFPNTTGCKNPCAGGDITGI